MKVCTDEYYDSIIESTNKNGPYYILCEGIAMPHGEIGKGVNGNGVGLSIFEVAASCQLLWIVVLVFTELLTMRYARLLLI